MIFCNAPQPMVLLQTQNVGEGKEQEQDEDKEQEQDEDKVKNQGDEFSVDITEGTTEGEVIEVDFPDWINEANFGFDPMIYAKHINDYLNSRTLETVEKVIKNAPCIQIPAFNEEIKDPLTFCLDKLFNSFPASDFESTIILGKYPFNSILILMHF